MKLDEWLTRLVPVPPGRSPLANGIAIGMRIARLHPRPFGYYRRNRDPFSAPISVSNRRLSAAQAPTDSGPWLEPRPSGSSAPEDALDEINRIPTRRRLNEVVKTGIPGFIPKGR